MLKDKRHNQEDMLGCGHIDIKSLTILPGSLK